MKKALILLVAILGFTVAANAQSRAIGARVTYGAELSYQHEFGGSAFGEFDLGWFRNGFSLTGIYDIIFGSVGDLNFYGGPGLATWIYSYKADNSSNIAFNLGIAAQLGMEYNFPTVPLQLSLDWRPVYYFLNSAGFGWEGFGLGIRYRF